MRASETVWRDYGDSRLLADCLHISVELGSFLAHQEVGGLLVLRQPLKVGPQPLWHLQGADACSGLRAVDSDDGSSGIEIAHLESGDFRGPHPKHQRHQHRDPCHAPFPVGATRKQQAHGHDLPALVYRELLAACPMLTWRTCR